MDTSLNGRTALITGGSLGLGLAMAKSFYSEGAKVAIIARRQEPINEAVSEISKLSGDGSIMGISCDVTDADSVSSMHSQVTKEFGGTDILVNNAGQAAGKPFPLISDEEWQADLDLKLMAAIRLSRLVWQNMESQKWGRIINLLNVFAKTPDANTAPTSISRAAGMALTKVLSAEGAPNNILVNALLIGSIKSDQIVRRYNDLNPEESFDEFVAKAGARLPMGRMGEAEECANTALFLASDASSYLTGCAINMDGGLCKVP
jgi:NAD(P)-dependent dehydrogenase (short-subunit alcohol dehydrogenase family)